MAISSEYSFPIFISSTDYNLTDLRAELANHLGDLGYRPILSSADGFPDRFPDLEPWESCLPVLEQCFVMILVIDGRYGNSLDWPHFKDCFGHRTFSPTHGEYVYAHKLRKRMLVFIREEILAYYQTYRTAAAKVDGDEKRMRELLANTLPPKIAFETLKFVEEVKTSKPIPWIRTFQDVTAIKREIQRKMLNELAEVFLIKDKHLTTVVTAFSRIMDDLSPEKREGVLQSIGVTRELIEKIESHAGEIEKLKGEESRLKTELENSRKEIKQGKKTEEEKTVLEKRVAKLTEESKSLRRQIAEREQANTSYILGGTQTTVGTSGQPLYSAGGFGPFSAGFSTLLSTSPLGVMPGRKCDGCGRHDPSGGSFIGMRQCPGCGKNYCVGCWPLISSILGRDTCPRCE